MGYEFIEVSRDEGVFVLALNRPEKLNAITTQFDLDWLHALQEAEADPSVRVVLQHGNGRMFTAGHDMVEVGNILRELGPAGRDWNNVYARIWPEGSPMDFIAGSSKPIISAVHGQVTGQGVPLVLLTDMIVAAEGTLFNLEAIRTGGAGGTGMMLGLLPPKILNELIFLGTLRVEDMRSYGVVNRVVPAEDLMSEALSIARAIARMQPDSIRLFKQSIRSAMARQGIGDPTADGDAGAASHGNDSDHEFWSMAAEKGVDEALRWRDQEFGGGEFVTTRGGRRGASGAGEGAR